MVSPKVEMEKELITDILDLVFEGRGQEIKTIGATGSVSLEDLSQNVLARSLLEKEIREVEGELENKVLEGNLEGDSSLKQLMRLARIWKAMKLLTSDSRDQALPDLFLVDALFLKECYHSLFPAKVEEEIFLTGIKVGRLSVFTKIVEVETKGSATKVEDLPQSSYRELRKLDRNGMPLLGVFHSHPNVEIPQPSKSDLTQFELYENHGLRALGAIFTKRGFLRFFTKSLEFEILITGSGVSKEKGDLYYLEGEGI